MAGDSERRLLALRGRLPREQIEQLIDYAEFLVARHGLPEEPTEPEDIPRPERETVIQAIRRLSATYPMLDRRILFDEAAMFMTQHTMEGRDAVEIIDELEHVFRRHYEALTEPRTGKAHTLAD